MNSIGWYIPKFFHERRKNWEGYFSCCYAGSYWRSAEDQGSPLTTLYWTLGTQKCPTKYEHARTGNVKTLRLPVLFCFFFFLFFRLFVFLFCSLKLIVWSINDPIFCNISIHANYDWPDHSEINTIRNTTILYCQRTQLNTKQPQIKSWSSGNDWLKLALNCGRTWWLDEIFAEG